MLGHVLAPADDQEAIDREDAIGFEAWMQAEYGEAWQELKAMSAEIERLKVEIERLSIQRRALVQQIPPLTSTGTSSMPQIYFMAGALGRPVEEVEAEFMAAQRALLRERGQL